MDLKKILFFKSSINHDDLNKNIENLSENTNSIENNFNCNSDANDLKLKIFGLSIRGSSHFDSNTPCQDACEYRTIDNKRGIISIADGLGSALHSEIGAKICVKYAVDFIQNNLSDMDTDNKNIDDIVLEAMKETRNFLINYALINNYNIDDLACTLIIVFIDGYSCAVSQIGDGAVVSAFEENISLLTEPNKLEYRNEVIPITSDEWIKYIVVKKASNFNNLAIFTDGVQDALMQKIDGNWTINYNGFKFLFSWIKSQIDDTEIVSEIEKVLTNKFSSVSNDDKTLIIATYK